MKSNLYTIGSRLLLLIYLGAHTCDPKNNQSLYQKNNQSLLQLGAQNFFNYELFKKEVENLPGRYITQLEDTKGNNIYHVLVNNKGGDKALRFMLALQKNNYDINQLLQAKNKEGDTPLMIAIKKNRSYKNFIKHLIEAVTEHITIRDKDGQLPVEVAIVANKKQTAYELMNKMKDTYFTDELIDSILHKAVKNAERIFFKDVSKKDGYKIVNNIITKLRERGLFLPDSPQHKKFMKFIIFDEEEGAHKDIIDNLPNEYRTLYEKGGLYEKFTFTPVTELPPPKYK